MGRLMNDEENISAQGFAETASEVSTEVTYEASNEAASEAFEHAWFELTPQAPIEIVAQAPIEILLEEFIQTPSDQALEDLIQNSREQTLESRIQTSGDAVPEALPQAHVEPAAEHKGKHIRKRNPLRDVMEFVVIILMAVIITMLLRAFVIDNYEIPTGSMEPTIEINDRVFAEKLSYRFGSPVSGDIVTFHDPVVKGRVLIKRCIAVGGQTINIKDGRVYVDGIELDEPYVHGRDTLPLSTYQDMKITYPYRVPEGMIWVMGDNRTNSLDSRFFGPVLESELIGKALFRFLPLSRFGKIE